MALNSRTGSTGVVGIPQQVATLTQTCVLDHLTHSDVGQNSRRVPSAVSAPQCGRTTVRRQEVGNKRCVRRMDDVGRDESIRGQMARMDRLGRASGNVQTSYTWPNDRRCR